MFQVHGYTQQVVAGINYQLKIRVKEGDQGFLHAYVFKPLPHTEQPADVQKIKLDQTEEAEFNWEENVEMTDESQQEAD